MGWPCLRAGMTCSVAPLLAGSRRENAAYRHLGVRASLDSENVLYRKEYRQAIILSSSRACRRRLKRLNRTIQELAIDIILMLSRRFFAERAQLSDVFGAVKREPSRRYYPVDASETIA